MLEFNFSPFPVLETDRLRLRQLTDADVAEVFALRSDPETMKYVPRPLAKDHEDAMAHIRKINDNIARNQAINWAVTLKDNDTLLGIMGFYVLQPEHFRAEIGYMINPEMNGKGYTSEAVRRIVEYGFAQMGLHSIAAEIDPRNIGSEKVLLRNGFVKQAHFVENFYHEGEFLDSVFYCKLEPKK